MIPAPNVLELQWNTGFGKAPMELMKMSIIDASTVAMIGG
jgi:hypothetical protein